MATNRDAYVNEQGHRIDPLTNIDITEAIENRDDTALCTIQVAQLEAMHAEDPTNWYINHSLRSAQRRLASYRRKAAMADLTKTVRKAMEG